MFLCRLTNLEWIGAFLCKRDFRIAEFNIELEKVPALCWVLNFIQCYLDTKFKNIGNMIDMINILTKD